MSYLNYGELEYSIATFPGGEWKYSYSAKELEAELKAMEAEKLDAEPEKEENE